MTIRIGDRIRIVAPGNMNGLTGTVYNILRPTPWVERIFGVSQQLCWERRAIQSGVHPKETAYCVDVDGHGRGEMFGSLWGFPDYWLRPLSDQKADEFLESLRKLKPLHEEPKVPTFRERTEELRRAYGIDDAPSW